MDYRSSQQLTAADQVLPNPAKTYLLSNKTTNLLSQVDKVLNISLDQRIEILNLRRNRGRRRGCGRRRGSLRGWWNGGR